MLSALYVVFYLLIFFLAGFMLAKFKVIDPKHSKLLSSLILYVFVPAIIIRSFVNYFTIANLQNYLFTFLVGLAAVVFNVVVGYFVSKPFAKTDYDKRVYRYAFAVPNGNLAWGFVDGLMGPGAILSHSLFTIPTTIYCYTGGYALLTKRKIAFKTLLNPITIALVIGISLGLLPVTVPEPIMLVINKAADCHVPCCMVVIGIIISEFKIRELLKSPRAWIFSLIRMVGFPLLLRLILPFIADAETLRVAVIYFSMPCGMYTLLFSEIVNEDQRSSAELVLVSQILAIATIPLVTLGLF